MGDMTISPIDLPAEDTPTVEELLNRHADMLFGWNCIDARHTVPLHRETPFDWAVAGYYAAFHDFEVRGYIVLAAFVDGKLRIKGFSEEECPEEYIDASPGVLNALPKTTHPDALRWRELVRARLRSTQKAEEMMEQATAA